MKTSKPSSDLANHVYDGKNALVGVFNDASKTLGELFLGIRRTTGASRVRPSLRRVDLWRVLLAGLTEGAEARVLTLRRGNVGHAACG